MVIQIVIHGGEWSVWRMQPYWMEALFIQFTPAVTPARPIGSRWKNCQKWLSTTSKSSWMHIHGWLIV
jgi:hypothetical protein